MTVPDKPTQNNFLKDDLYDALRWLFEGAITWEAARRNTACALRHQSVLGMYASLVQARALYEFFYKEGKDDDARAKHFAPAWKPQKTQIYQKYMGRLRPANKRVFHLVYNRTIHAGGSGHDDLKNQVLEFAKDLRRVTEEFAQNASSDFRDGIQFALNRALEEAKLAAKHYSIPNPL
jgi:hypothetical protein